MVTKNGFMFFACEEEHHPKSINPADPLAPNPVHPIETCDYWSPKNDYCKYGGYPQVCFNCFHSTAIEITKKDLFPEVPEREF